MANYVHNAVCPKCCVMIEDWYTEDSTHFSSFINELNDGAIIYTNCPTCGYVEYTVKHETIIKLIDTGYHFSKIQKIVKTLELVINITSDDDDDIDILKSKSADKWYILCVSPSKSLTLDDLISKFFEFEIITESYISEGNNYFFEIVNPFTYLSETSKNINRLKALAGINRLQEVPDFISYEMIIDHLMEM